MVGDDIERAMKLLFSERERAEFSEHRTAVFFKPGRYRLDSRLGYYTTVAGLGMSPDDVQIDGKISVEGLTNDDRTTDGALVNFWRSLENVAMTPTDGEARWAVSQASPLRRVHVHGDLALYPALGGFASGGFMADVIVEGQVRSGSQQQWFTRGSELGSWSGGVWNMAFSGVIGAPPSTFPTPPITSVQTTEVMREKPFIVIDKDGLFQVFVPSLRRVSNGATWSGGQQLGESRPLSGFFIAHAGDSASTMNRALQANMSLLITPGVYLLDEPLIVRHPDTIVLGIGMATLVDVSGRGALQVDDLDGVVVAGLIFEAGAIDTETLVTIGQPGANAMHYQSPTSLSDVFFRVGGARPGAAVTSLMVNSNDVVIDHLWAWRADHGVGTGWNSNVGHHGLVVNGDDVSAYGVFVEHYEKNQVVWNGEGGRTTFYQSELPYDVPDQGSWNDGPRLGYASYRVADGVNEHSASALGIYSFFNTGTEIEAESAVQTPSTSLIHIVSIISSFLGGSGGIRHPVNEAGTSVGSSRGTASVVHYPA